MTDTYDEPLVGGNAFHALLSAINPSEKLKSLKDDFKSATSVSKKDQVIKQLKYVAGLQKTGLSATDAYVISHMPVIPPIARPATVMGGNRIEFADVNNLYKDHMVVNSALKDVVDLLPPDQLIKERSEAYRGAKAVMGLGDAISPNSRGRGLKGLVEQVSGNEGPKSGLFHSKVLSKKQDFSGRSTIYAEPNLAFNEAAIPEDMVWNMYKFHVLRDLSKNGYDYVNANKAWEDRSLPAKASVNKLIKEIPILLNRAPTLMKSNVTAFYPKMISGKTIGFNPLMLPLFAADYDGDSFSTYVPQSPEAVKEAKEKLIPKIQIHDYRKGVGNSMVAPGHEAILGSMHMTEPDTNQKTVNFKTETEALEALKRGDIQENTPITIGK